MSARRSTRKNTGKKDETEEVQIAEETVDEKDEQPDKNEKEAKPDEVQIEKKLENVLDKEDEPETVVDKEIDEALELIEKSTPETPLEIALTEQLKKKESQIERLSGEVAKLKTFISKRKQTYKRKRKDEGAPTRALSAYNIFVQNRFSRLAKENEKALQSSDVDALMKRVPPASLVASTGNEWKDLAAKEKSQYEELAKTDKKRYKDEMAKYNPPEGEKQTNRRRNKTGYNMFFSAHVLSLKNSSTGVPSERGSVARLVGEAWKAMSDQEKQYYEKEADKQNGQTGSEEEEDASKRPRVAEYPGPPHGDPNMQPGPPPPHGYPPPGDPNDPRHHHHYYPPHPYGPPHPYPHPPPGPHDYPPEYPPPGRYPPRGAQGYRNYPPPPHYGYEQQPGPPM
eukprot:CAMPEP_0198296452 /NCGR_PEP_ID=MMETSP1449-20131203/32571_1 /TAXON_ID=420275 /ORGANISM="Attheya septentrionalis, Strain CCMP2084" /LENGTH=396 /DNA_ID=CAMNT_0043997073 /DNA_START=250 /DNA_END=1440 /DNA_ORIENTATION=+